MKEISDGIKLLIQEEYVRASNKFGTINNSSHESYAVIKEELEEALWSNGEAQAQFDIYWEAVKSNNYEEQSRALYSLKQNIIYAISEWIQVAAMCKKALLTLDGNAVDI